ncbi:hypothetical protein DN53_08425 [Flagellimonas olearia]|uniref:Uncharacterized protein n=1 Tax=Flagellimonas olearia TaxID=552546 RepID=A0A444VM92_9FLAO|nr:hypothetical protein DN53_08425 [Allomuricauda olearia]
MFIDKVLVINGSLDVQLTDGHFGLMDDHFGLMMKSSYKSKLKWKNNAAHMCGVIYCKKACS